MSAAYAVEVLKFRRSRVVAVATVGLLLAPALMARAFLIAAEGGGADPMSAKAVLLLPGIGWTGYLGGLIQIYATAGVIGSGIVVGWCFGREYADRTVVSLYASATPRTSVARAKLVLLAVWAVVVGLGVAAAAWMIGTATGLGLPDAADGRVLVRLTTLAVLSGLLALPVALPASIGRGYLPAVGGLLVLVVAAQVATVAGAGTWWPWSVAAVWAMGAGSGTEHVAPGWLAVVPLVVALSGWATVGWWRRAEVV
ncbi:ABC transporter permease [Ornithinimicrobium avium]|uniref:ABC transporter permease n=1 Tax=Ornithinimicrobium avium TaxID=2283195 RepID=A0A345NKD4_9MICO|nr:ABC transporter permease [Ornithinimicrobium avium]AXH95492.1 ABC transporter permease [Ornithinimicrobium avium]